MTATTRDLIGPLYKPSGAVWANAEIKINLLTDYATFASGSVIDYDITITTDEDGDFRQPLAVPDEDAWLWRCMLPDNKSFNFTLAAGAEITLHALMADNNLGATVSASSLALYLALSQILNDPTLASESEVFPATEGAVKTYVDNSVVSAGVDTDGSPTGGDFAQFVDANTLKGLSQAEMQTALNVENGADVTDATNVNAAGATMNADADVSGNSWVVDEDDMVSNLATKVPTEKSVKAYADAHSSLTNNPHGVTAAQAGAATSGDLTSHTGNTSNPHSVTAAQAGAAEASHTHTESDITDLAHDTSEFIIIAVSDETSDLEAGGAVVTFRMPYALTLSEVRASVAAAPAGSAIQVDINEGGSSILSTEITIDAGDKTSEDATTPPVISDSLLADNSEITIDIDAVGSSTAGAGLKIYLIGAR